MGPFAIGVMLSAGTVAVGIVGAAVARRRSRRRVTGDYLRRIAPLGDGPADPRGRR